MGISITNNESIGAIEQEIITARGGEESLAAKLAAMVIEGGGNTLTIETKTETATITLPNDKLILCNATSGAIIINLPAVAGVSGKKVIIVKTDASVNTVTTDADESETINGETTLVIEFQNSSATLVCNGTSWNLI